MKDGKQIESAPIYLRLMFFDMQGESLVDVGVKKNTVEHWIEKAMLENEEIKSVIFQDTEHSHLVLLYPYDYKGSRMGIIIAEVNHKEVVRQFIQSHTPRQNPYLVLTRGSEHVLKHAHDDMEPIDSNSVYFKNYPEQSSSEFTSFLKIPVPNSPFVLATRATKEFTSDFLMSPWYLLSLGILALLVLYSMMMGIRSRMHNLLLHTRFEESERHSRLLNEQNLLLEEENRKRLDSEAHLRTLVETIPDLVWLKNMDGVYLACNRKFERFLGVKEAEIIGKTDYDFFDKELADFFRKHDKATIVADTSNINEESVTYADDGHEELLETIKTPFRDSKGQLIGVLGIARDITDRKRAEEEFIYLSVHDPLTGLYNRRVLEQRINEEMNRAKRYNHALSVFMVDIDHFKQINDHYGHQEGDAVLCKVAEILERSIRNTDYAARYGGEEFVVILPDTSLSKAEELALRLCHQIAGYPISVAHRKELNITVSIGIANFPQHQQSGKDLLIAADSAMYRAKKKGRNQVKTAKTLVVKQKKS